MRASGRSSGSRGRMFGSGKASIASACLETITLCSHPDTAWKPPSGSWLFRSSAEFRSFHQFSAATVRRSTLALPALYFCKIRVNSASRFSSTGRTNSLSIRFSFLFHTAALPPPPGEVPQCAHWGGEGCASTYTLSVTARTDTRRASSPGGGAKPTLLTFSRGRPESPASSLL